MHQQEALKVTELGKGVVAGENGLHALLTADADTNMSSCRSDRRETGSNTTLSSSRFVLASELSEITLDHADIVGTIPDCQSDSLLVFLDQLNHLSLLQRGNPAANHCLTHTRCPQQLQLQVLLQPKGLRTQRKKG